MSLNDCLHTGPSLTPLLFEILVRFRENRAMVVRGIEKAFLNISIHVFLNISIDVNDRDCSRFLWVDDVRDSNLSAVVYRFCRVLFGLNVSPFLLNGTITHHLATFAEADPGDGITNKAYDLYSKAKVRMANRGFKLHKWKTNDPKLKEGISLSDMAMTKPEIV